MDQTESRQNVEENGVSFVLPVEKKRTELLKFYNPKHKLIREIVQASLNVEVESSGKSILCLDADAGSGISALQWKKQLGEEVQVIAADKKLDVNGFEQTCNRNSLSCSCWDFKPDRLTGEWSNLDQGKDKIHFAPFSVHLLLHHEAFNFVYLQPNNSITSYVDAMFTNLRHNGVACFVSPNISSQCFRSPKLIHQFYQAHVQKTEYVKEMAARIVISDIVRSASRHCRGVDVLYTVCHEDNFLIAVRVVKKTQAAVECAEQIRPVLHCLMCEERVVYPDTHSPVEMPYGLLPCDCKEKYPGKTAVLIGPMWTGEIFNMSYLQQLVMKSKVLFPKSKTASLLEAVLNEAVCESLESNTTQHSSSTAVSDSSGKDNNEQKDSAEDEVKICTSEMEEPPNKKRKTKVVDDVSEESIEDKNANVDSMSDAKSQGVEKEISEKGAATKTCVLEKTTVHQSAPTPLFYRNLHKQKCKVLPRYDKLVKYLHREGYRASRTHFEDHAVRTNATGKQLEEVINRLLLSPTAVSSS